MKRKVGLALILIVVLCCSLYANGSSEKGKTAQSAPVASEPKTELVIAMTKDINGLDPHKSGNTLTSAVQSNMYEWLIARDAEDNLVPCLAESWENIDETTWRFTLRSGVKFHSGNPLTSRDVQFSLMRIQGAEFSERLNYTKIKEVRIIDDLHFDIITDGPDPVLLNRISRLGSGIMDSKLFEEIGESEYMKGASGTGPYKFSEWKKDEKVVMVANDDYWGEKPVWRKVTWKAIPEESTRVAELLTGNADVALDVSPTDEERINNQDGMSVLRFPTKRIIYWVVNTTTPGLDDVRVRRAIDLAIDDQLIVDELYNGAATVTESLIAPTVFGCDKSLIGKCNYDLDEAKRLLKESGHEGFEFELASGNGQYLKDKELTELVAIMLEQAGFKVKVSILETSRFTEIKNARGFTGLRMNGYSSSMSDALKDLNPFSTAKPVQFTGWLRDDFVALYKENEVSLDQNLRQANFEKMQQMMAEDLPIIPMFQLMGFYGASDSVSFTPRSDEYIFANDITPVQK